jgi:hypothetical protein
VAVKVNADDDMNDSIVFYTISKQLHQDEAIEFIVYPITCSLFNIAP